MSKKVFSAGTQWAFFGFVADNYNLLLGNSASAMSNGDIRPMFHLTGIREAGTGFGEDEAVQVDGDDGSVGSIEFENAAPRRFIIELSILNLDLEAALQGSSVWEIGNFVFGARDVKGGNYPDGCLILQSKAKRKDVIATGAAAWSGLLYPRLTMKPLGEATRTSRTAFYQRFSATAQLASHHPVGITASDVVGASSYAMPFTSNYPMTMEALQMAGGGDEDFVLSYPPVSNSIDDNILYVNRERLTADYTITPATRNLNINNGAAAATRGTIFYHFDPAGC